MNRNELLAVVVEELRSALPLGDRPVLESDPLRDLPEIDSLRLVRIGAALEEKMGAEFTDEALFGATTVGSLVDALATALAARA